MQKSLLILCTVATLVAICMIIAFSSCAASTDVTVTPTATVAPTPTRHALLTRTATVAPKTAIPTHAPLSTPLLGSSLDSFTARYGPANDHSTPAGGLYHFVRYPGSNLDEYALLVDLADGGIYADRVESITIAASNARDTEGTGGIGWTKKTAEGICGAFFPADAKYLSQVAVTGGYDVLYSSSTLATLFPASAFQDAEQNQSAAGTFDVQYLVDARYQLVTSCSIQIGQQQTR